MKRSFTTVSFAPCYEYIFPSPCSREDDITLQQYYLRWKPLLFLRTVCHKQNKAKHPLGNIMRDHLTFDWCVYFSRPIRFSRTLVCGLFKNPWFSFRRYFKVLLSIFLMASQLAFSGSAVKTLFRAPTIPPATQASRWKKMHSEKLFLSLKKGNRGEINAFPPLS